MVSVLFVVLKLLMSSFRFFFFFQAEDGIRDLVRSRGLGDVYKRQIQPDPQKNLFSPAGCLRMKIYLLYHPSMQTVQALSLIHI